MDATEHSLPPGFRQRRGRHFRLAYPVCLSTHQAQTRLPQYSRALVYLSVRLAVTSFT